MATVQFSKPTGDFSSSLRKAIDSYFTENKIKKSGDFRLYSKTAVIIMLYALFYIGGLFLGLPSWAMVICFACLGFVQALVGFNIMHDACHDAFSTSKKVNFFFGLSMNVLGTDHHQWRQKHNIVHHTYTNVDGVDDDIAKSPLMRMSPNQPRFKAHRFQHIYLSFLYAVSTVYWVAFKDFQDYFGSRQFNVQTEKMSTANHFLFWLTKTVYFMLYVVLPIYFYGVAFGLIGFFVMHMILGTTMSFTFQLAHVVENVGFEEHDHSKEATMVENEWTIHQLNTTSDFAPNNKIITWIMGGLNFQVEHHLFPRISHIHYPAIQKIVKQKCEEFGVKYNFYPTTRKAIASHFRHMRNLGKG